MATAVSTTVSAQAISAQSTSAQSTSAKVSAGASMDSPSASACSTAAPWKRLSVGQFLRGVNWENKPAPAIVPQPTSNTATLPPQELTYRLSVGQFFNAIPWDGSNPIAQDTVPAASLELPLSAATIPGETVELPDLDEFADGAADAGEDITLDDFFGAFPDA